MGDEKGSTELAKQEGTTGAASLAKAPDHPSEQMWLSNLTPSQAKALRELLAGARTQEAADAAGVDRVTLYRWRTQDPQFMAALSAWRNETHEHAMDQMLALADASVCAVAHGIAECDSKLGLRVLKEINRTREKLDRPGNSSRSKSSKVDPDARVDQIRHIMRDSSPWEQIHVAELLKLGLEEHRTRMAEKFRSHFGLRGDFEVSPQQLELAASGALPDPKEYDPRKLDPDHRKLEGAADTAPATLRIEDLASQEMHHEKMKK